METIHFQHYFTSCTLKYFQMNKTPFFNVMYGDFVNFSTTKQELQNWVASEVTKIVQELFQFDFSAASTFPKLYSLEDEFFDWEKVHKLMQSVHSGKNLLPATPISSVGADCTCQKVSAEWLLLVWKLLSMPSRHSHAGFVKPLLSSMRENVSR